ncbi:MAG: YcaO-like family protein [Candidatus Gygaella obscura]|nr:YcaO-like family protein [Candidatus Gygaella obscura]
MKRSILKSFRKIDKLVDIPQYTFEGSSFYNNLGLGRGTNGKGYSKMQAMASGIMELVERYSCFTFMMDKANYRLLSFNEIENSSNSFKIRDFSKNFFKGELKRFPNRLRNIKVRWYKAFNLEGERLYLPSGFLSNILEGSNGMASGNSIEEALLQAICEIIERWCMSMVYVNKISTPFIDIESVKNKIAKSLIDRFEKKGHEIVLKDFSLGFGIPAIAVIRKVKRRYCYITLGVASNPYKALIRALTENSQISPNIIDKKSMHLNIIDNVDFIFKKNKIINMSSIENIEDDNIKNEIIRVRNLFSKRKIEIFFHDTTDKELRIPSVMVFIKGAKYLPKELSKPRIYANYYLAVVYELILTERYDYALKLIRDFRKKDKTDENAYRFLDSEIKFLIGVQLIKKAKFDKAVNIYHSTIDKDKFFSLENMPIPISVRYPDSFNLAVNIYMKLKLLSSRRNKII